MYKFYPHELHPPKKSQPAVAIERNFPIKFDKYLQSKKEFLPDFKLFCAILRSIILQRFMTLLKIKNQLNLANYFVINQELF